MFIDESGDLGFSKGSSRYFIISALIVENPKQLDRIIKNARRNKFKKNLKTVVELKANKSTFDLIKYVLNNLSNLKEIQIFHIILDKREVKSNFLKEDKHKLYNFVAGKLAKNILMNNIDIEIIIDKSKGKIFQRKDFNAYFERKLSEGSNNLKCKIEHKSSFSSSGLQIVDFLVWSVFKKYERNESKFNDNITIEQEVYQVWN
jgi:hypothetical protein